MSKLDDIIEDNPDVIFLKADGFDDAVIGFEYNSFRLVYSVPMCIDILTEEGMEYIDAIEHFNYNVCGSYVGEQTPIWCVDSSF